MRLTRATTTALTLAAFVSAAHAQTGMPALEAAVDGRTRRRTHPAHVDAGRRRENLNLGQNVTPCAESQFEVAAYRRSIHYPNRRWFLDQTRVPKLLTSNMAPQRQRQGLDGAEKILIQADLHNPPAAGGEPGVSLCRQPARDDPEARTAGGAPRRHPRHAGRVRRLSGRRYPLTTE